MSTKHLKRIHVFSYIRQTVQHTWIGLNLFNLKDNKWTKMQQIKGHLINFFIGWSKNSWTTQNTCFDTKSTKVESFGLFFTSIHQFLLVCHCIIYNSVPLCMKPDKFTTIDARLLFFCSCRSAFFFVPSTVCVVSFAHLIPFSQINIYVCVCAALLCDWFHCHNSTCCWSSHIRTINGLWCQCSDEQNKIINETWFTIWSLSVFLCHCIPISFCHSLSMDFSMEWLKANLNANSKENSKTISTWCFTGRRQCK